MAGDAVDDDVRVQTQQSPLASQRAKEEGQAQTGRFATWFPLGAKEGFNQWWAGLSPEATEHRVLSFIPYLQKPPTHTQTGSAPVSAAQSSTDVASKSEEHTTTNSITDPYGPRRWNSEMVELSGKGRALNEFSVERIGEEVENNLVMVHGYGAGLGFFYRNFEAMSRAEGWKVFALDLLGMGRSSRPAFKIHAKDKEGKIKEAENWFVDALEEWRIKRGLDRFTLLGHSLGGYLAVAYALKYPGRLNKLILASPVGIPEDPYAVNEDIPAEQDSAAAEIAHDASVTVKHQGDNNNFLNQREKADEVPDGKPPRRRLPGWLSYLWDTNSVSPFALVRWSGPLGPRLVSGWTSRRFSHLPQEEAQALHDYSYALFRQKGSSEYALFYILAPGAFARNPLIRRIEGVGRQWIQAHDAPTVDGDTPPPKSCSKSSKPSSTVAPSSTPAAPTQREHGIPIVFMYGDRDWMDVAGGYAAEEKIKQERARILATATKEERERDQGEAKVVIINNAGHHVYLDGWDQFNRVMLEEMEDVKRRERQRLAR
ncbi:alpha/beta-hydrolase [Aaosphaeria arxii CBS 175.79]|uniref:Alpha/beta-hydrolase n=1 Tax=Aaosphaeria arxii CBS 175.79 TaxID=1450172 RepID=A0A6A5XMR6_9PLEO|nr:alpha/beta-hydrolase [Aaosphaeria arxii CBS 175.79]KAF2014243.1 alpha/beta-hydrolase [Aaosphaeria arxii CBS 175.79]